MRASGVRARRSPASSIWRRDSGSRRARCARPLRRWPPTTSSCGGRARARSSRPIPRNAHRASGSCASGATTARTSTRAAGCIDVRRGKASADTARWLDLKPGDAVIVLRRVLEYRGAPVVLDEITLPAGAVPGTHQGQVRRLPRVDVRLFRDPVRRPDAEGPRAIEGDRRRCGQRGGARRRTRRAAARGRARDIYVRRSCRRSRGAACARRAIITT